MVQLRDVEVPATPVTVLGPIIGSGRLARLEDVASGSRALLAGRVVWNVSSTSSGGGVAEMLRVIVSYIRGAGVDSRWVVIEGDPAFFAITKRIHNRIHGWRGDGGALGEAEGAHYAAVSTANASALLKRLRPGDAVVLHDPQTAGMAPLLLDAGVKVIWRVHIGADISNATTDEAWAFLRPHISVCDALVFSRQAYVPAWVPPGKVAIIPPSIDPFSPKNQMIPVTDLAGFLAHMGLVAGASERPATFTRGDGTSGQIVHRATLVKDGPLPEALTNLVVQVSRWDRLKDMGGVMRAFASWVPHQPQAYLALVGPAVEAVTDDPEGGEVLAECVAQWEALPARERARVLLVTLPMWDTDENAAMVNALQRSAAVIMQKSLAEGFGLTVAEGMWKGKPVVASRVGGIIDQVVPGTGILLDDPSDLEASGEALAGLLARPDEIARLGANAHRHILEDYVGDRHLLRYASLMERLFSG